VSKLLEGLALLVLLTEQRNESEDERQLVEGSPTDNRQGADLS
jgi:hypothetical protein